MMVYEEVAYQLRIAFITRGPAHTRTSGSVLLSNFYTPLDHDPPKQPFFRAW